MLKYTYKKPCCPKCGGTSFGVNRVDLESVAVKPLVAVCASCGAVIGILPEAILERKPV
jgi:ribosomal protein S27AE